MKILLIKYYSGFPAHGMEYRPYYLAHERIRFGHRMHIVAASNAHVRANQPQLSGNRRDEQIDGISVIASDFPLWKEIVERAECGICVGPLEPEEIAEAIQFISEHPAAAEHMGKNGRRAVEERCNWGVEESKLLGLYEKISQ